MARSSRSLVIRLQRRYASSGCITKKSMDTESAREGSRDQRLFRLWDMYIIFPKKRLKYIMHLSFPAKLPVSPNHPLHAWVHFESTKFVITTWSLPLNVKLRMRQSSAILNSQPFCFFLCKNALKIIHIYKQIWQHVINVFIVWLLLKGTRLKKEKIRKKKIYIPYNYCWYFYRSTGLTQYRRRREYSNRAVALAHAHNRSCKKHLTRYPRW